MQELRVMVIVTITELEEDPPFRPVENSPVDGFKVGDRQIMNGYTDVARKFALDYMLNGCVNKAEQEINERWHP